MVAAELGVGALERGVPLGLGPLDAVHERRYPISGLFANVCVVCRRGEDRKSWKGLAYPFRCALRDWLCWDEFFDSARDVSMPTVIFEVRAFR